MAEQLVFELPVRRAMGQADFLVSPTNEVAVKLVDAWPHWPSHAVAVVGPPGAGKTHLAAVWREKARAVELSPLEPGMDLSHTQTAPMVLIEDADRGMDETELFHCFNLVREFGGSLLLTGRTPPNRWRVALPDLRSRLATVHVAALGAPDDLLLKAVLAKHFKDRQLIVTPPVLSYLLVHMERSFDFAARLAAQLDHEALKEGRGITRPLARRVLNRMDQAHTQQSATPL